jgi:hypothetical protein
LERRNQAQQLEIQNVDKEVSLSALAMRQSEVKSAIGGKLVFGFAPFLDFPA